MTSIGEKKIVELLRKGLEELSLSPFEEYLISFKTYLLELQKWNRVHNLTGIKKDVDIITKHFLDSLLYMKGMPQGALKVADVGTGAGFPGLPIKIIRPEIEMFLIESSVKKTLFLRHIINLLKIKNIKVIEERVENIEKSFLVDIAMTRALFTIDDFIKKASHLVKDGGVLIHSKGPKVREELKKLKNTNYEIIPCNLPLTQIKRYIVVVRLEDSMLQDRSPARVNGLT
jgi:16S rRNA (guanine527-N7)-methyltransferase